MNAHELLKSSVLKGVFFFQSRIWQITNVIDHHNDSSFITLHQFTVRILCVYQCKTKCFIVSMIRFQAGWINVFFFKRLMKSTVSADLFCSLISSFSPQDDILLFTVSAHYLQVSVWTINCASLAVTHWPPHKIKEPSRFFSLCLRGHSVTRILLSSLLFGRIASLRSGRRGEPTLFTDLSGVAAQVCLNQCVDM